MKTSERLKYIRQQTGLSQERFADLLKEKLSRINSIEAGKQAKFPYDLAEKILKTFPEQYYNFKWLTTGEGEPFIKNIPRKLIQKAEKIAEKLLSKVTDAEFELLMKCLKENKELTIMFLKKLQNDERSIKSFLLDN